MKNDEKITYKEAFEELLELLKEIKVLVNINIKDDQPHNAIRFYNMQGNSCGFGENLVNDGRLTGDQKDLFANEYSIMYLGAIDFTKIARGKAQNGKFAEIFDRVFKDNPESK